MSVEPYYQDESVTLYNADCRDVLPHLETCDAFVTDTPYGIDKGSGGDARKYRKGDYESNGWDDTEQYVASVCVPIIASLSERCVRGAVTTGVRCMSLYPRPADIGCFWTPAGVTHGPWGFVTFSPILYYGKDFRAGKGALPSGKSVTESSEKNGHPCVKPIGAWRWLVDKVSQPGETIIDPFVGSGTTLVAAVLEGRKAIGIEISKKYCDIAVSRLRQRVLF